MASSMSRLPRPTRWSLSPCRSRKPTDLRRPRRGHMTSTTETIRQRRHLGVALGLLAALVTPACKEEVQMLGAWVLAPVAPSSPRPRNGAASTSDTAPAGSPPEGRLIQSDPCRIRPSSTEQSGWMDSSSRGRTPPSTSYPTASSAAPSCSTTPGSTKPSAGQASSGSTSM